MKKIIIIILAVALCLSAGYAAFELTGRAQRGKVYEELKESVVLTPAPTEVPAEPDPGPAPEATAKPEKRKGKEPYVSPIDFEALWRIDPNIFAWIRIEGTNIDYPVVKHPTDDEYYLNHTIEGFAGYPGSIYSFGYTATNFSQFNTIIYGHNMDNGTMFADLNKYLRKSFLDEHRKVTVYTPDAEYSYTVFAFLIYDDRLIDTYFDQRDLNDRQAYLDSFAETGDGRSYVLDDIAIDIKKSHLLTLVTCHSVSDERTVVVAVRDNEA